MLWEGNIVGWLSARIKYFITTTTTTTTVHTLDILSTLIHLSWAFSILSLSSLSNPWNNSQNINTGSKLRNCYETGWRKKGTKWLYLHAVLSGVLSYPWSWRQDVCSHLPDFQEQHSFQKSKKDGAYACNSAMAKKLFPYYCCFLVKHLIVSVLLSDLNFWRFLITAL